MHPQLTLPGNKEEYIRVDSKRWWEVHIRRSPLLIQFSELISDALLRDIFLVSDRILVSSF
jgi:hypothetical protein